jgi:bifunctional non-homologous end joining protein LigD
MTGTVSSSGRAAAPRAWWDEFQCYVLDRTVGAVCGFLAAGRPSGFERWKAARSCVPLGLHRAALFSYPALPGESDGFAISWPSTILISMQKTTFTPCIPTRGTKVPAGPEWFHEIKHDGYRLIVQREGKRVRLFTRNGHDWTERYPLIGEAALKNRASSFVIDGEAVLLGVDGMSDFNELHSRRHNDEVQLYAFGSCPLACARPTWPGCSPAVRTAYSSRPSSKARIGPDLFRAACDMGLEGLVSKRRDRPYRAGRSPHWIKVKNRSHPAMERVKEPFS